MSQSKTADAENFAALVASLRAIRDQLPADDPSDRALARAAKVSPTTIAAWLAGAQIPQDISKFLALVDAIAACAEAYGLGAAGMPSLGRWRAAYEAEASRRARTVSAGVQQAQAQQILAATLPLARVRDPFMLEVHRSVEPDHPQPNLPLLPIYVQREHDTEVRQVVMAAAGGRSGIAVLVGESSTGKTRACWEALELLRNQSEPWRLWHPIVPTRPDAVLRELPHIGPRTVIWLNEAQLYLSAEGDLGERVAAGLRDLLRDANRAPVLVLATLWPRFWYTITARPPADADADQHAQARDLLAGHDITVPATLGPAQMSQLAQTGDARLMLAARSARDGEAIQFLAGAPELLARYRNAPPGARALIHAAMDARRLGMGAVLRQTFLANAAPCYLTDAEWDQMEEGWLERALAYTEFPCKGARGPLTRIRPRPTDKFWDQVGNITATAEPLYRLADYLDQHGRTHRAGQIPPAGFWSAAAAHAAPRDQAALGAAANARGLYRDAAQLHKNASASGNLQAVFYFMRPPACLGADPCPVHWAAIHAPLDNPTHVSALMSVLQHLRASGPAVTLATRAAAYIPLDDVEGIASLLNRVWAAGASDQASALAARAAVHALLSYPGHVAALLRTLRKMGAADQATALMARNPAASVVLDSPYQIADLLRVLRDADATDQAALLATRAAARAPLDYPGHIATLLTVMHEVGAHEQVTALADRAAARAPLDYPGHIATLLTVMHEVGAHEQVTALADRAAAHAPLDHPGHIATLHWILRNAEAYEQVTALADRAAARAPLDHPGHIATLLTVMHEVGAHEQVTALADRAAARAPLDHPGHIATLLDSLWAAGAHHQITALLAREPAAYALQNNPADVARLLYRLRKVGAHEQVTALADRAAARAPLDHPGHMATLLTVMHEVGAHEQVTALADRAAARAPLDHPGHMATLLRALKEVGEREQAIAFATRTATHTPLDHPGDVAFLLRVLQHWAGQQADILADRAEADVPLDKPDHLSRLLREISMANRNKNEEVTTLAHRIADHVPLDRPYDIADLLGTLRYEGAHQQVIKLADRAVAHTPLDNPDHLSRLLDRMQATAASQQAAALADRIAAHAPLDRPDHVASLLRLLQDKGTREQVAALAERGAAHTYLDDPRHVATLLTVMQEVGAHDQTSTLVGRLPAAGMFELFLADQGSTERFYFGRETDGTPARAWKWSDLDLWLARSGGTSQYPPSGVSPAKPPRPGSDQKRITRPRRSRWGRSKKNSGTRLRLPTPLTSTALQPLQ